MVLVLQHGVQKDIGGILYFAQTVIGGHRTRDIEHERNFDFRNAFFRLTMGGHFERGKTKAANKLGVHVLACVDRHGAKVQTVIHHDIRQKLGHARFGKVVFHHRFGVTHLIQIGSGQNGTVRHSLQTRAFHLVAHEI